jgi:putative flippase GtrA
MPFHQTPVEKRSSSAKRRPIAALFCGSNRRSSPIQLFRYASVGVASNLAAYLLFVLITHLGLEPKRAMTFTYAAGAIIGFFANRKWTFSHRGGRLGAAWRYGIAHLCGYLINFTLLYIFVDRLGYPSQWVQAFAIFLVSGFLFVTFKFFVFPAEAPQGEGSK